MSERKKSKNAIKVTNNTIIDTLILGAGPIGLYCGQSCLKNNIKFLIFEKKENIGGQISALYPLKNVYDYPFKKNVIAQEIIEELKKGIENSILLNVQIINIVKKQNLFHVKYFFNNNDYKNKKEQNVICKNVINCTGIGEISFRKIDFPIDNINNVLYSVNDPQIFKDKKVIVLGGGDSASDWTNQLSSIAKQISLVYRKSVLRNNKELVENVRKYLNFNVLKAQNNILYIKENDSKQEKELNYDFLLVLYGLEIDENNISLFIKIRTKENKIIVNKNQQTNLKNFYAAGDCCWGKKEYKIASGFLEIDKIIEQIK